MLAFLSWDRYMAKYTPFKFGCECTIYLTDWATLVA